MRRYCIQCGGRFESRAYAVHCLLCSTDPEDGPPVDYITGHFWRGVCSSRAMLADELADRARSNARLYLDLPITSAGYDDDARAHKRRAADLRRWAGAR